MAGCGCRAGVVSGCYVALGSSPPRNQPPLPPLSPHRRCLLPTTTMLPSTPLSSQMDPLSTSLRACGEQHTHRNTPEADWPAPLPGAPRPATLLPVCLPALTLPACCLPAGPPWSCPPTSASTPARRGRCEVAVCLLVGGLAVTGWGPGGACARLRTPAAAPDMPLCRSPTNPNNHTSMQRSLSAP